MGYITRSYAPEFNIVESAARELARLYVLGDGVEENFSKAQLILEQHLPADWKRWEILYNHLAVRNLPAVQQAKRLRDTTLAYLDISPRSASADLVRLVENNSIRLYSVLDVQLLRKKNDLKLDSPIVGNMLEKLDGGYIVTEAFKFPDDMHGARSRTFLIPDGIPMPTGDPSHNELIKIPAASNGLQ